MSFIPNIQNWWNNILENEFSKDYFKNIEKTINKDKSEWITIFPKEENIFNAFLKTDLADLKVVILWQDPYHGENQAQWFSFSVPEGEKIPPSLRNIYKELKLSLQIEPSTSGDLTSWTKQWVFLLNAVLTVQKSKPASHSKIGWETFTDNIIKEISDKKKWVIFLLWWAFAQSKKKIIDESKHIILETSHPSPFSAHRWFLWSNCFKETNKILRKKWEEEINWEIKNNMSLF